MKQIENLTGVWKSQLEAVDRLYAISYLNGNLDLSVTDSCDGEEFVVSCLKASPKSIRFDLTLPSTGVVTKNRIVIDASGTPICFTTYEEIWKQVSRIGSASRSASTLKTKFAGEWRDKDDECSTVILVRPSSDGVSISLEDRLSKKQLSVLRQKWRANSLVFSVMEPNSKSISRHELTIMSARRALHRITLVDRLVKTGSESFKRKASAS